MELYVLLEGYVSKSIPESYLFSLGQIVQSRGLEAGATEVYTIAYFVVCNGEIPGARFLPVSFAIGETCVPSAVVQFACSGGRFPIDTCPKSQTKKKIAGTKIRIAVVNRIILLCIR